MTAERYCSNPAKTTPPAVPATALNASWQPGRIIDFYEHKLQQMHAEHVTEIAALNAVLEKVIRIH